MTHILCKIGGKNECAADEAQAHIRELEQEIESRDASRKELDARWVNLYDETRGLYLGAQAQLAAVTQERDAAILREQDCRARTFVLKRELLPLREECSLLRIKIDELQEGKP